VPHFFKSEQIGLELSLLIALAPLLEVKDASAKGGLNEEAYKK
jgi:hypothetical protein